MAIQKLVEGLTYAAEAGEDLTGDLNKFVKLDNNGRVVLCGNDEKPLGTLFEEAAVDASGTERGAASVQLGGIAKVIAGGVIAAGARVACGANGLAKAGTTNPAGIALSAATGSGSVISVALIA